MQVPIHFRLLCYFLFTFSLFLTPGCKKENSKSSDSPGISTSDVTEITSASAICGGNVTSAGNSAIISRGICWSTSENPTVLNTHTSEAGGLGEFTSSLANLHANTRYFVRAYATNSGFTSYGEQKQFTTLQYTGPSANLKANTTIADLLLKYPGACDSIADTMIISGLVTANDESGNLYKKLVIQDQSAGLEIEIENTALYVYFKVGQRVFVRCKGLFLGRYHGLPQLGSYYQGGMGRISSNDLDNYIFPDSLPGTPPDPVVVDPSALNLSLINRLIKIENVKFTDPGTTWADIDASGNRFIEGIGSYFTIRTSNFANFGRNPIPFGIGSIQGILDIYGTSYQLILRDSNDITGFDNNPPLYWESLKTGLGSLLVKSVTGDQQWEYKPVYGCAAITGYASGNHPNEDWLITPPLDLSLINSAALSFSQVINHSIQTALSTNHTVWISKNYNEGDPSAADWEQLTIPIYPPGNDWTFYTSGTIEIPVSYLGQSNVCIGFKYLSNPEVSSDWELKNIVVE
ncbi:MAG: hypothetical protein HXX13_04305 [Bacteroidetes bacterium]|nr:hypothetical protein [Bacteroidota bacterium]